LAEGETEVGWSVPLHWLGEYLNKVALTVLDLTQECLHELSAMQRWQTELLGTLHRIITKDVDTTVDSTAQEWSDMLEREAKAMHKANQSRFNFLKRLHLSANDHMGISIQMEDSDDEEEEERLQRGIEKARQMLKTKPANEGNLAEGAADAGRGVKTSADDGRDLETSAKLIRGEITSADDAEGSTASTDEADSGKTSADEGSHDMDVDESAKDDPKVKMESEEP